MTRTSMALAPVIAALLLAGAAAAAGADWPTGRTDLPAIAPGESVTGALERSDSRVDKGAFADHYRMTGKAGTTVYFRIEAFDFKDPRLAIYDLTTGQELEPGAAFRSGSANVTITLPSTGDYLLRVTSKSKKFGRYAMDAMALPGS